MISLPAGIDAGGHEALLARLNGAFEKLGGDYRENISRLSAAAGEVLGAGACAYAVLDENGLRRLSGWNIPDAAPADGEGICENLVIASGSGACTLVTDLPATPYFISDPIVSNNAFLTYAGIPVKVRGRIKGIFSAFFTTHRPFGAIDEQIMGLIAHMLAGEQDRFDSRQEILVGEEKFGAFFRSSLDGVLIHDLAGRVVDANPSAERMFGYPHAWLVRMNLTRLVPVESAPIARQALREVKATGYSRTEIVLKRMDGSLFSAEIVGSRFEVNGEPRVHGIVRDISQRKQAQDEAAERDLRFRKVFEQSLDGIVLQDQNGSVIEANGTMCKLLGCSKEDVVGMGLADLHPEKDLQERMRFFQQVQSSGESRYECEFLRGDGSTFSAEVAASSFSHGGHT
ncbi:MAG: hypothetical protein JWO82_4178, partial [Akkermansiaceae bacterium]|nr:hypothetical protein [Akkermansiaceae bacterium]